MAHQRTAVQTASDWVCIERSYAVRNSHSIEIVQAMREVIGGERWIGFSVMVGPVEPIGCGHTEIVSSEGDDLWSKSTAVVQYENTIMICTTYLIHSGALFVAPDGEPVGPEGVQNESVLLSQRPTKKEEKGYTPPAARLVGVELNPGPQPDPKVKDLVAERVRRSREKRKGSKAQQARAAKEIVEQVKEETAKAEAVNDTAKELADEARQEEERALDLSLACRIRTDEELRIHHVRFELVSLADEFEPQVGLIRSRVTPVQVCDAVLDDVRVIREGRQLSLGITPVKSKFSIALRYHVMTECRGILGHVVSVRDDGYVWISFDMLRAFEAKQLSMSYSYLTILHRLEAFIPGHLNFHFDHVEEGWFTPLANRVFVALLMRGHPADVTLSVLWDALTGDCGKLYKACFRSEVKDEPPEAGTYVQGYEVTLMELFPEACQRILVGGVDAVGVLLRPGTSMALHPKSLAKEIRKSKLYCRLSSACHIRDFPPCFPDPHNVDNVRAGIVKRLLKVRPAQSELSQELWLAIGHEIASTVVPDEFDPDAMLIEGMLRAKAEPWTENERDEYMRGVLRVVACHNGSHLTPDELGVLRSMKWFVKQETYPQGAKKAPRIIVCPSHFVRGLLWALLHNAEKSILRRFAGHTVKGLTRDEITKVVNDTFGGSSWEIIEGDATSFELHMDGPRQRRVEVPVYTAAAPRSISEDVFEVMDLLSHDQVVLEGGFGEILPPIMRYSGTMQTSVGNLTGNCTMWFAQICDTMGIPVSEAARYFREYPLPYLIEGDDILMAIPPDFRWDRFQGVVVSHGNELKADIFERFEDANFCGNTLLTTPDGYHIRMKEPLEALSRVFAIFGAYDVPSKQDLELLVAKARSYLIDFPGTPILAEVCQSIVTKYGNADRKIREALRKHLEQHAPLTGAAREFYKAHSYDPERLRAYIYGLIPEVTVPPEMRARVQEAYGYALSFQHRVVTEFREGLQRGDTEISVPTLTAYWGTLPGVVGLTVRRLEGARARAMATVQSVRQGLATIEVSEWIPLGIRQSLHGASMLLTPLVALLTWFLPIVVGCFGGVIAVLTLLGAIVVYLSGYPTKYYWRVVTTLWLFMLGVVFWPVIVVCYQVARLAWRLRRIVRGVSNAFWYVFHPVDLFKAAAGLLRGHTVPADVDLLVYSNTGVTRVQSDATSAPNPVWFAQWMSTMHGARGGT